MSVLLLWALLKWPDLFQYMRLFPNSDSAVNMTVNVTVSGVSNFTYWVSKDEASSGQACSGGWCIEKMSFRLAQWVGNESLCSGLLGYSPHRLGWDYWNMLRFVLLRATTTEKSESYVSECVLAARVVWMAVLVSACLLPPACVNISINILRASVHTFIHVFASVLLACASTQWNWMLFQ